MDNASRRIDVVAVHPRAAPLPLGYAALACGSVVLASLHLGWIPVTQGHEVGLLLLVFVAPLQTVAALMAWSGRDTPQMTELGLLAVVWLASGLIETRVPPGGTSDALGILQLMAALALVGPVLVSAATRRVPALVGLLAAVHFALLGVYELSGTSGWKHASGGEALALAACALYASVAVLVEESTGATKLPLGRRGAGRAALEDDFGAQLAGVEHAPGVRQRL
jgi:succinate-acetate transporter protein